MAPIACFFSLLTHGSLATLGVLRTPSFNSVARRAPAPRLDFDVQPLTDKEVDELDILNWPGLEKRTQDFFQEVPDETLKMVYVKEGAAVVGDEDESKEVEAGQLVSLSNGTLQWTRIAEGGVVLLCDTLT